MFVGTAREGQQLYLSKFLLLLKLLCLFMLQLPYCSSPLRPSPLS